MDSTPPALPHLHTGSVRFMKGPDGKHAHVQRIDAKDLDLNLLVMARQEYTTFLHSILKDKVKAGLLTQYNTAVEESPSPIMIIKTYQKILKETPLWNQNIVRRETERVLGEYRLMFPNLIALIYVAKVKIMASVRVTKGTSYVALSIPSPESFVHQVYIECAHILYENPTLCHLSSSDVRKHFERNDVLQDVVRRGTEEALSIMLPVKDILSEYLNNSMLENSVFSMGEGVEEEEDSRPKKGPEQSQSSESEEEEDERKHFPPVGDDFLKQALVRPEETRIVHTRELPIAQESRPQEAIDVGRPQEESRPVEARSRPDEARSRPEGERSRPEEAKDLSRPQEARDAHYESSDEDEHLDAKTAGFEDDESDDDSRMPQHDYNA